MALPVGPAQIVAGPGSGKTRVLTHRIAWLVHEHAAQPRNILAVTFTNKAAGEMRDRTLALLQDLDRDARADNPHLPASGRGMAIATFHSVCARILRVEQEHTPYRPNWAILDAGDQQAVMKSVLAGPGMPHMDAYAALASIGRAKDRALTADEYARNTASVHQKRVASVYAAYEKTLLANNALDFDDLLMQTVLLFRNHPRILDSYRVRWPHVLVDEFQDTNAVQYELASS